MKRARNPNLCVCVFVCVCIYCDRYIYRESEIPECGAPRANPERERDVCVCLCVCVYVYIATERYMERARYPNLGRLGLTQREGCVCMCVFVCMHTLQQRYIWRERDTEGLCLPRFTDLISGGYREILGGPGFHNPCPNLGRRAPKLESRRVKERGMCVCVCLCI